MKLLKPTISDMISNFRAIRLLRVCLSAQYGFGRRFAERDNLTQY